MARGRGRKNAIVSVHLLFNFFGFLFFLNVLAVFGLCTQALQRLTRPQFALRVTSELSVVRLE